jgi:hypothetical protein
VGNQKATPPKKTVLGYNKKKPVRIATSDLFIDKDDVPVDYMVGVIFEEIGGQELISQSSESVYNSNTSEISNIYEVSERYSPLNILNISDGMLSTLGNIDINLNSYLPQLDLTLNLNNEIDNPSAYIDSNWKNLIIEFEDAAEDFNVEVEIISWDIP